MATTTRERTSVRRPAEPTGDAGVDNAIHSLKTDMAEMEERLVEHMDERFDKVDERLDGIDADLKAIKDHLGVSGDGS